MKRVLTYLIIAMVLIILAAFLAGTAWLFGTTAGARQVLDAVSRYTDIKISADKTEGKLAGTLRLENTTIQWPGGKIGIQHLELCTRPFDLLTGRISIPNLSLRNISIADNTPEKPPELIWPQAAGLITLVSGKIGRLEINNLIYRHLDKDPLQFQKITASADWQNATLSIGLLQMTSDLGVARGNFLAGFNRPLLEMDLTATPVHPPAGMEFFRLAGKFGPGKQAGELTGSLRLSGLQNKEIFWDMSAEVGMTSEGFPLRHIRLQRPGRPGSVTADGMLTLSGPDPFLTFAAQAADIDLAPDWKVSTNLSGSLTFAGSLRDYRGHFDLANRVKGWQSIRLTGDYSGNAEGMSASSIRGSALGGTLGGQLDIEWPNGLTVKGEMTGRNLNPAGLDPNWAGVINFDLSGQVSVSKQETLGGEVICTLQQSRLHGQQLTGDLRATFTDDDIRIQHLALQGKGFQLTAAGAVKNKLDFTARISDLSRLVPETAGRLTASGWARRHQGRFAGTLSAEAHDLKALGLEIASAKLNAAITDQGRSPLSLNATLKKVRYQSLQADRVTLQARGTRKEHDLLATIRSGSHEANLTLSGTYHENSWQGKIIRLDGTDSIGSWRLVQPAALSVTANSFSFSPLNITGRDSESIKISGDVVFDPLTGSFALDWNALNLDRVNAWLNQELLTGTSSGNIHLTLLSQKRLTLAGKSSARGTIQIEGQTININQSEITVEANEQGMRAGLDIRLARGGTLQGTFTSSSPARLEIPDDGLINLHWRELNLAPFSSLLPGRVQLEGRMAGEVRGKLLANRRFDLTGHAALVESKIRWQEQKGDISALLRNASLNFVWQDEALRGDMTLTMADYGKLQGRFRLPVAARFPLVMDDRGTLQVSLTGQVQEKGALGILFPGLVQESRGNLDLDLLISGSPAEPLVSGNAHLSKAGAYLPTAGITIKDAQIAARLAGNTITIDSFRAVSGPGHIEGSALIRLKGRQIIAYEGRLNGERFQTIYFPELQVQSSPRLTFAGTAEKISVRGEVGLPLVQIIGSQSGGPVEASPDVIREGQTKPEARKSPVDLDVQVKLILGEQVEFKGSGIDAQLGGQIDLQFREIEKIAGRGEIRVTKGRFRTYGVNLDIVRGRLFYAGGPINQPLLDILALRKVGEVKAGVAVSGTIQKPLIKLYSEPVMQDMDILAYIVLGHPLGADTRQASLLATAAGALLTSRQSEDLLSQIKNRLGLSTLNVTTDVVEQNGQMGYKRITVTPPGTAVNGTSGSVSESILVVGKYLTPQLYISYGRSLFSGGNLFFLRYDISKSWQVETQTGQESGVDIYYKLEFN